MRRHFHRCGYLRILALDVADRSQARKGGSQTLEELCEAKGLPHARIGAVHEAGPDATLEVSGQFTVSLAELRATWTSTIPAAMEQP